MARKGKQSLADTVDESEIIESGEITSEPNIIIDDEWGIRGGYRDYALVTKKIAHRTGKYEDGENEGKVIRYEKWEDVLYCGTIFECLRSYQEVTNLSKIKALKNCKDYFEIEKIYKSTNATINSFLKHQDMVEESKDIAKLLDTISQLQLELKRVHTILAEADELHEKIKEKRQILINDTEPKKHRVKLEKQEE